MIEKSKVIEALENRIKELQKDEWSAKDSKDYVACIQFQGAVTQFKKFLKEMGGYT